MSSLKTGLNAPFYNWLDEVRRAFRKEKELLEKLTYYNVMFIGYKGVNYGQVITNPMPRNDKDMLYWIDKIDETERRLKKIRIILIFYQRFVESLEPIEKIIIQGKCEGIKPNKEKSEKPLIASSLRFQVTNRIIRKWNKFVFNKVF